MQLRMCIVGASICNKHACIVKLSVPAPNEVIERYVLKDIIYALNDLIVSLV